MAEPNGAWPLLTISQRADIAAVRRARRAKRAEIDTATQAVRDAQRRRQQLKNEMRALPTDIQLARKYGVSVQLISGAEHHRYKNLNPLDARRGVSPAARP